MSVPVKLPLTMALELTAVVSLPQRCWEGQTFALVNPHVTVQGLLPCERTAADGAHEPPSVVAGVRHQVALQVMPRGEGARAVLARERSLSSVGARMHH